MFSRANYWFEQRVLDGAVNLTGTIGIGLSSVSAWFDKYVIDAMVNGAASLAKRIGDFARHFQTGRLQHYLVTMLLFVLTFFVLKYFTPLL